MKLTEKQLSVINDYIDNALIDKNKLIDYLENHRTIKNDVFSKCSRKGRNSSWDDENYCGLLDHPQAFMPITREVFIRRIPFLFHCPAVGNTGKHKSGLWRIVPKLDKEPDPSSLEDLYNDLEFMFYSLKIDLQSIMNYSTNQVFRFRKRKEKTTRSLIDAIPDYSEDEMFGVSESIDHDELFDMWRDYLKLCVKLKRTDYLPDRFLTAYNYALEEAGEDPIIYRPYVQYGTVYFTRHGDQFTCKGNFPCDNQGNPILRWTNIRVKNAKSITFSGAMSCAGTLTIEIQPNTTIHLLGENNYADTDCMPDDTWYQIYAGPLNMEFNYQALKDIRMLRGFTQKEVADAIGANVRTYQKWESNGSTPDGHYLLRIMNWLQIENVQALISYVEPATSPDN